MTSSCACSKMPTGRCSSMVERGDDGAGDGSLAAPFKSLPRAVDAASGRDVYVRSVGTYDTSGATLVLGTGTSLYGGFDAEWNRDVEQRAVIDGADVAIVIDGPRERWLSAIELTSADGAADRQSVAVVVVNGDVVHIEDSRVLAGAGGAAVAQISGGASVGVLARTGRGAADRTDNGEQRARRRRRARCSRAWPRRRQRRAAMRLAATPEQVARGMASLVEATVATVVSPAMVHLRRAAGPAAPRCNPPELRGLPVSVARADVVATAESACGTPTTSYRWVPTAPRAPTVLRAAVAVVVAVVSASRSLPVAAVVAVALAEAAAPVLPVLVVAPVRSASGRSTSSGSRSWSRSLRVAEGASAAWRSPVRWAPQEDGVGPERSARPTGSTPPEMAAVAAAAVPVVPAGKVAAAPVDRPTDSSRHASAPSRCPRAPYVQGRAATVVPVAGRKCRRCRASTVPAGMAHPAGRSTGRLLHRVWAPLAGRRSGGSMRRGASRCSTTWSSFGARRDAAVPVRSPAPMASLSTPTS